VPAELRDAIGRLSTAVLLKTRFSCVDRNERKPSNLRQLEFRLPSDGETDVFPALAQFDIVLIV
jgi:hypothetical protein